jgi:hypothetical protein
MKNILFYFFFLIILSCNSVPPKVGSKEKSTTIKEQKMVSDFFIYDITIDTLKLSNQEHQDSVIFYMISGKIKNTSDKTFIKAIFEGQLKIKFDNKEIIESNSYLSTVNNKEYFGMKDFYHKWKPNQSYNFTFKTIGIDKIYSNYTPKQIEYLLSLKAEDPVGYVFNDRIFHKDLKSQWVFKK